MRKDKLLQSQTPKVYKSHKLNQASFGNLKHTDYRVFLHLVTKIGKVNPEGLYLQPDKIGVKYKLEAKELEETFNVDRSHCYKILKQSCKKLMKTSLVVENLNSNSTKEINICSVAEYHHKEGSVSIEFTEAIIPYLAQVKEKFTLYNLKEISLFSSIYTTRLYELLQDFKTTGWMVKSLDQLRTAFSVENKYKKYGHFKSKTFVPACNEINKYYNWNLQFEEIKEGRKVTAIRFFFKKTIVHEVTNQYTGKTKNLYEKPEKLISENPKKIRKKVKKNINSSIPKKDKKKEDKILKKRGIFSSFFSKIFR